VEYCTHARIVKPDVSASLPLGLKDRISKPSWEMDGIGAKNNSLRTYGLGKYTEQIVNGDRIWHPANPIVCSGCINIDIGTGSSQLE